MIFLYTDYWIAKLSLTTITIVLVLLFYSFWTGSVIRHLVHSVKLYRANTKKDFFDNREQEKILYNNETHIVKYVILVLLCCAEMGEVLLAFISGVWTTLELHGVHNFSRQETNISLNECTFGKAIKGFFPLSLGYGSTLSSSLAMFQDSLIVISCIAFLLLLSFLTQYLSKRYYQHSYRKTMIKHYAIFLIQLAIIFPLCNKELFIIQILIAPILVMIDWCILVRNCRKLRSVLKSNVRDLNLHFTHRSLYRQQLKLLQRYTVFMPILLTALFFGGITLLFHNYSLIMNLISDSYCLNTKVDILKFEFKAILYDIQIFGTLILISIHFLLLGFPIYVISLNILLSACTTRFHRKEQNFRFNYTNFRDLKRFNLRSPY